MSSLGADRLSKVRRWLWGPDLEYGGTSQRLLQSDAWGGCCLLRGHWGIGLLDGVDFGISSVFDNSGVGDGDEGPPSDTDIVVSGAGYVALVICN